MARISRHYRKGRLKAHYLIRRPYKIHYQDLSFSTIIRGEVPYRLNVVSGNIALSSIAVELCEHLRLVKETPAKVCINLLLVALYFRNYTTQVRGMAGLLNYVKDHYRWFALLAQRLSLCRVPASGRDQTFRFCIDRVFSVQWLIGNQFCNYLIRKIFITVFILEVDCGQVNIKFV